MRTDKGARERVLQPTAEMHTTGSRAQDRESGLVGWTKERSRSRDHREDEEQVPQTQGNVNGVKGRGCGHKGKYQR